MTKRRRGRPRKKPVKIPVYPAETDIGEYPSVTVTWTHDGPLDVRDKGRKSDEELLDEFFQPAPGPFFDCWPREKCDDISAHKSGLCQGSARGIPPERKQAIEAELGKDRIQDERLRRLAERTRRLEEEPKGPGYVGAIGLCILALAAIIMALSVAFRPS